MAEFLARDDDDPSQTTRRIIGLLALFVGVWTAYQIVANSSIGLHPDNVEMFAWSRHPSAGYPLHPPLGALIAAAWFSVFPVSSWSLHLLMMTHSALALFIIDLIARRYVSNEKRILVLLVLLLTPIFQFRGDRFSVNMPLLSTWPLATYCFLRAFQSRTIVWSALAGVTAAMAMLAKYYSIYMIAGFVVAALVHPARWTYLKSPSPWISMLAGAAALMPHVVWLFANDFGPFHYALTVHAGASSAFAAAKAVVYLVEGPLYVAILCAALAYAAYPKLRPLAEAVWPRDPDRRMLAVILAVEFFLPVMTAPWFGAVLTPLWTIQEWFLLPILLLSSSGVVVSRARIAHVGYLVAAATLAVLLASPAVAWVRFFQDPTDERLYYRDVSEEVTDLWHQAAGRRLPIVTGGLNIVSALNFYSSDQPDAAHFYPFAPEPWITKERMAREGWAMVCDNTDTGCVARARALHKENPASRLVEFTATARFLWWESHSPFTVLLTPPGGQNFARDAS
jgi:4-amino-4-deoxy-L-arabinose transferase-like glycosyltransferase